MSQLLPIFRHASRRHSTLAQLGAHPCSTIDSNRWHQELLTICRPSIFFQQEGRRRSLATNRRTQRMKSKSIVKGSGSGGPSSQRKKKSKGKKHPHQLRKEQERNVIRPPKNYLKNLPTSRDELSIPPALLVPTASPYVYISKTALGNDDEEEEDTIDPTTLFVEVAYNNEHGVLTLPPLFAKGDFHYFSPKKDLNYDYPTDGLPEIAFLGRSNVGKSSLINAIMRKNLCLTSRVPGRTQLPYYYGLVPKNKAAEQEKQHQQQEKSARGKDPKLAQGFIVDLPGYGYGRAPMNVTEDWQKDTQDLLLHRRQEAGVLQRLFLLMDARRGMEGPNEHDRIVMRWLEDAEIPFSVVLTKADRVSMPLIIRQVNDFCLRFASQQQYGTVVAQSPVVHVTSSAKGWGINELMVSIESEFCAENDYEEGDVLE
jgi:GTP-binding protein